MDIVTCTRHTRPLHPFESLGGQFDDVDDGDRKKSKSRMRRNWGKGWSVVKDDTISQATGQLFKVPW